MKPRALKCVMRLLVSQCMGSERVFFMYICNFVSYHLKSCEMGLRPSKYNFPRKDYDVVLKSRDCLIYMLPLLSHLYCKEVLLGHLRKWCFVFQVRKNVEEQTYQHVDARSKAR